MNKRAALPAICVLAVFVGCGGGGPSPSPSAPPPGLPAPDHVLLVVLENHSFSQVIGSASMPYLNGLAAQHGLATNYFANAHPSIGNYFMLTTGQIVTTDNAFSGTVGVDNLARALTASGKTWKAYAESLPFIAYSGGDAHPYMKRHNPFAYFTDIVNSPVAAANMVPFSQIFTDLRSGALPAFAFIAPNVDNDAHDCPGGLPACADSAKLATADQWLQGNLGPLITSPALANSVFIITWDESIDPDIANGGGQVATVLVGSHVKTAFQSGVFHQHQDTLRLILDLLRVPDLMGASATATNMGEFFQ